MGVIIDDGGNVAYCFLLRTYFASRVSPTSSKYPSSTSCLSRLWILRRLISGKISSLFLILKR